MLCSTVTHSSIAVSCRGVVKDFGTPSTRARALQGVDLDVHLGELTFLVGPSGSGKSTLISVITGILAPDGGTVEVLGVNLAELGRSSLVNFRGAKIGIVFQQFNLFPALTALENVAVAMYAQGHPVAGSRASSREILDDLGLSNQLSKYPAQLSVGEQQRVALARALVHQPNLVVCDEPTAALDAASGLKAMQLLRRIAVGPHRAVIVVTHDDRILPFADRVAHMRDGRITHVATNKDREAA